MNIFASSPDPDLSARVLADRHIVKMTLETAQILSTVFREKGLQTECLYRATHQAHPCVRWVHEESFADTWLVSHGMSLADEYQRRFSREHASSAVISSVAQYVSTGFPRRFVYVGDLDLACDDPHQSYRCLLSRKYAAWGSAARWTRATMPPWYAVENSGSRRSRR